MELVSVIIPTFNRSGVLLKAIHSVLNQTYKNFELIIVDDGSTDHTTELLNPFIANHSLRYFKTLNQGVAAARNFGTRQASGNWFAFLDSDDEWLPTKLEEQINYLCANKHLNIVYTEEIWMRNGIRVNQKNHHKKAVGNIFEQCLAQCFIGPSSVLLSKKLFLEMRGFDESFVVCEDYDLWLKISSVYEIGFLPRPLVIKNGGHADQLSTKFFAMDMWRLRSMYHLMKSRTLNSDQMTALVLNMQRRSAILLKGYRKHGNSEAIKEVEMIMLALSNKK